MARPVASVWFPAVFRERFPAWPRSVDLDGGYRLVGNGINAGSGTRLRRRALIQFAADVPHLDLPAPPNSRRSDARAKMDVLGTRRISATS